MNELRFRPSTRNSLLRRLRPRRRARIRLHRGRGTRSSRVRQALRAAILPCRQRSGEKQHLRRRHRQRLAHRRPHDAHLHRKLSLPGRQSRSPGGDELRWDKPVFPGDELSVRATVLEARRSESRPDRGIVRTFIEVLNQKREVVMSMKMVNFVRCRQDSSVTNLT